MLSHTRTRARPALPCHQPSQVQVLAGGAEPVVSSLRALPSRARDKLPAYSSSECACLLRDLAAMASLPQLCELPEGLASELAGRAAGGGGAAGLPLRERAALLASLSSLLASSDSANSGGGGDAATTTTAEAAPPSSSTSAAAAMSPKDPKPSPADDLFATLVSGLDAPGLSGASAAELANVAEGLAACWRGVAQRKGGKQAGGGTSTSSNKSAEGAVPAATRVRVMAAAAALGAALTKALATASGSDVSRALRAYCPLPRPPPLAGANVEPLLEAVMASVSVRMRARGLAGGFGFWCVRARGHERSAWVRVPTPHDPPT